MKLNILSIYMTLCTSFGVIAAQTDQEMVYNSYASSPEFYSQASQDKFVHTLLYPLLNKQDAGYFVEIGASWAITINNTYVFEKNYNWKGASLDISKAFEEDWKTNRTNPLIVQDATTADYNAILESYPTVIDYLSLDVDGFYDVVLEQIPFDRYTFKVITIEHDSYRYGDRFKNREREILSSLGYYLLCPDVNYTGCSFEDWWIHPSAFPPAILSALTSLDLQAKDHIQLIQAIETVVNTSVN